MLPYPEPNFSNDAINLDPSPVASQSNCASAAVNASAEVRLALPLPSSASTHLRKFSRDHATGDTGGTAQTGFEKRNREFAIGRHCARTALQQLGITAEVPVDTDRKPLWPTGIIGSISHRHHYAWAAVAKQASKDCKDITEDAVKDAVEDAVKGIGIDTEIVVDDRTIRQVAKEITVAAEQKLLSKIHDDVNTAFTIVFSAKESIYKCLYPLNEQFFGFHDVLLVEVNDETITFAQQPSNPNYAIAPRELTVRYAIHQTDVFSAIWI